MKSLASPSLWWLAAALAVPWMIDTVGSLPAAVPPPLVPPTAPPPLAQQVELPWTQSVRFTEGLTVRVGLDRPLVEADVWSERRLVVQVLDDGTLPSGRSGVTVMAVVDVSGSMAGEPLQEALRALHHTASLLEPHDELGIVTFQSAAAVMLRPTRVDRIEDLSKILLNVRSGGGTQIPSGIALASEVMATHQREGRVGRIVLFSDGQDGADASAAPALVAAALADGVAVSTAGLGTNVNDILLNRMAVAGGGRFHFLPDAAELASMLGKELAETRAVVAQGLEVFIPDHPALQVDEVFLRHAAPTEGGWTVPLGDLQRGESRKLVARVRWNGLAGLVPLRVQVRATTVTGNQLSQWADLPVTPSADPVAVAASLDDAVASLAAQAESHAWFERASLAWREGDVARAQQLAQQGQGALKDAGEAAAVQGAIARLGSFVQWAASAVPVGVRLESNFTEVSSSLDGAL
jgi:Ca-activated chloride channel family protein